MTARHEDHCLYVPSTAPLSNAPMLVMLHGATQDPDDFAAGTAMNQAAERHGFVVLYPAQSAIHNSHRCWHWFDATHQSRSAGEPARITSLALQVAQECMIDSDRIYVAGMSAGGAMAALLGTLFPEVYAAVGVHSGLPANCASDLSSGLAAMRGKALAPSASSGMPTIVFHGDRDCVVSPINGAQLIDASCGAQCLSESQEHAGADGRRFTRRVYRRGAATTPCGEHWTLHGGGHRWSGGRSDAGSYADDLGPDASEHMLRFLKQHRRVTRS